MYARINGDFFDKERVAAQKRAVEGYAGSGRPVHQECLWLHEDLEDTWDYRIDVENNLFIAKVDNKLGYFEIAIPYDLDFEIAVLEHASKQINKMKAALQSMK